MASDKTASTTPNTMESFTPLVVAALVGCRLMAGLFFVFSVAVMRAFGALPPETGMAAMRSINVSIVNPIFLLVFMGTAALCALVAVLSLLNWQAPGARYLMLGSALYLIGGLLVTVVVNVPMNDALAAAHPGSTEALKVWASYLTNWTAWNHVRTVACLAATVAFTFGLTL